MVRRRRVALAEADDTARGACLPRLCTVGPVQWMNELLFVRVAQTHWKYISIVWIINRKLLNENYDVIVLSDKIRTRYNFLNSQRSRFVLEKPSVAELKFLKKKKKTVWNVCAADSRFPYAHICNFKRIFDNIILYRNEFRGRCLLIFFYYY